MAAAPVVFVTVSLSRVGTLLMMRSGVKVWLLVEFCMTRSEVPSVWISSSPCAFSVSAAVGSMGSEVAATCHHRAGANAPALNMEMARTLKGWCIHLPWKTSVAPLAQAMVSTCVSLHRFSHGPVWYVRGGGGTAESRSGISGCLHAGRGVVLRVMRCSTVVSLSLDLYEFDRHDSDCVCCAGVDLQVNAGASLGVE
jgi:hypothetical protein